MDVMISTVVLEDISRQPKTTMIINSFNNGKAEENHSRSCSHSRDQKRYSSTQSVKQHTFKWVIAKGTSCIRDNQPVMLGVHMVVQKSVLMHVVAMHKVLPCVHHKHCNNNLYNLDRNGRLNHDP